MKGVKQEMVGPDALIQQEKLRDNNIGDNTLVYKLKQFLQYSKNLHVWVIIRYCQNKLILMLIYWLVNWLKN